MAQNKPEPSGKFQWTIGIDIVQPASAPDEITKTGDETSTFVYTPKVLNVLFVYFTAGPRITRFLVQIFLSCCLNLV